MNIICIDSKYNVRRCDVLVQNKTIHSLNLSHLIEYLKMVPELLKKSFHGDISSAVVCIIVFIVSQSGLTSLCFVDDLSQILGMFSLNSIGCVTKCGPAGILEGNTTDRWLRLNVLKSSYRKI